MLTLKGVCAGYAGVPALRDVDLVVPVGRVTALLGANGAGKSTLVRAAMGELLVSGTVALDGVDITRLASHRRARAGLCVVADGRGVFPHLTVAEHARLFGAAAPALPPRQLAGTLSGGQQQLLALSRLDGPRPKALLLDEVSAGLAAGRVDDLFARIGMLASSGVAVLVVEQYAGRALALADSVCVLRQGRVVFHGSPAEVPDLLGAYLGLDQRSTGVPDDALTEERGA
ncbi:MAG: ATP-binding cassette domain-containing protein [Actinomycetota bacterium]|nr:ATP-binding cassette domain-containing protein [Actinomycetota bacterium]